MSGSSNLNSFRDRGQVAVQLVSCGVLLPGLVEDCTQHSCVIAIEEKISIEKYKNASKSLNQRNELIFKCRHKNRYKLIGVTQTSCAGLGSTSNKVFSKMGPKGKRDMVSKEVRMFEEEQRKASAITQAKQCAWTKWNNIEPIKLLWKSLIAMEPLVISFLLRSTYDLLPNATNLKLWECINLDLCLSCKRDQGTLCHVLSACPQSLWMYT